MNTLMVQSKESVHIPVSAERPALAGSRPLAVGPKLRARVWLAVPVATLIALAVHWLVSRNEPPVDTRSYSVFLGIALGSFLLAAVVQSYWLGLRRWMTHMCPIIAAAVLM